MKVSAHSKSSGHRLDQRGGMDLYLSIMLIGLVGAAMAGYLQLIGALQESSSANMQNKIKNVDNETAIETFVQAYRWAQLRYIQGVAGCGGQVPRPFLLALRMGSGCPGTVRVFSASSGAADPGRVDNLYTYLGNGCNITMNNSTCESGNLPILSIGESDAAQKFNKKSYRVTLARAWPELKSAEFILTDRGDGVSQAIHFFMKDFFDNLAHLEPDGRVVQESPIPLSRCVGAPWGQYRLFYEASNECREFSQLGSGSGMAYYKRRFFGFRPADGLIVDLMNFSAASPTSYIVNSSNGTITGLPAPVFVPYPNPAVAIQALINVDDITLIDDQIYYVAGMGPDAEIGYANPNGTRTRICNIGGTAGWSQAYSGIAALGWSDALIPDAANPLDAYKNNRYATFFLKTDSGDLITTHVYRTGTGPFSCSTTKDPILQQVEYARTLGFDRTEDAKPYFTF